MAENNNSNKPKRNPYAIYWIYAVIVLGIIIAARFSGSSDTQLRNINTFYSLADSSMIADARIVNYKRVDFKLNEKGVKFVKANPKGELKYLKAALEKKGNVLTGSGNPVFSIEIVDAGNFETKLDQVNERLAAKGKATVSAPPIEEHDYFSSIIGFLLPILIIVLIWVFVMRRMSGGGGGAGGQIFNIGKSRAQVYEKGKSTNITFKDVAGLEGAKEEIQEIVEFLRSPQRYTELGAKIPKGALLVGPPGTGKTLLAKAVAGEAKVPFFSLSGSDFVEMFVGVGASRVRDLFRQAKEKAPAIIFIDEIDAIGRARGKNVMMSNDERENTLNQLLVEMDGFGTDSGIIILAATNRPDVLDSALLRPGRFDRQISIDKPDLAGREAIFDVHLKPIKTSPILDIKKLASMTPGFAGADIANVCNEAALIAARKGKTEVEMDDFNDAVDRVIGGLEKKNKIISPEEKEIIAFHEAGHAICGWYLEHANPLVKVTIVPRGVAALGYAQYLPKEQYLYNTEQLLDDICMTLGGRAIEEIVFGKVSTGAQNDLQVITRMAYAMVTVYGMNAKVGNVSFYDPNSDQSFTKPYSEETAKMIDEEVRLLIDKAYQRTKSLLTDKIDNVRALAGELLKKEVLYQADLERLIGKRPYDVHKEHIANHEGMTTDGVHPTDLINPSPATANA